MRLQDEIKAFNEKALASIPPESLNMMVHAAEKLAATGISNRALSRGDTLPPFSLTDVHGQVITSEELQAKGPLVINFYRGSW